MTEGPGYLCSFLFASDGRIHLAWSGWSPIGSAVLATPSFHASHWLGCTEVFESLQKCLQTIHYFLLDQGEERKMEVLPYKGETATN